MGRVRVQWELRVEPYHLTKRSEGTLGRPVCAYICESPPTKTVQHLLATPLHLAQRVIPLHELLKVHQKRHVRLWSRFASHDPIPAICANLDGGIPSTAYRAGEKPRYLPAGQEKIRDVPAGRESLITSQRALQNLRHGPARSATVRSPQPAPGNSTPNHDHPLLQARSLEYNDRLSCHLTLRVGGVGMGV